MKQRSECEVIYEELKLSGADDFFDMNQRALSGASEMADDFEIGEFKFQVISDTDNEAYCFEYWANDMDEAHFEIVLTYWLNRGGKQGRVVGEVVL